MAREKAIYRKEMEAARKAAAEAEPFPADGIRSPEQRKPGGHFEVQQGTRKWYGKNGELLDGRQPTPLMINIETCHQSITLT